MLGLRKIIRARRLHKPALAAVALIACCGALLLRPDTRPGVTTPRAESMAVAASRSAPANTAILGESPELGEPQNANLTHDFGIVPPGSVVSWKYPICNTSDSVWTIEKVEVHCRCTVPGVSSSLIAPGETEQVKLRLDCGRKPADIVKTATVEFKEPGVAPIKLTIKASVRAPMTPGVSEISFVGVGQGAAVESAITLENYSAADWRELRVENCPPWAEVKILPPRPLGAAADDPKAPRQVWPATVKLTGEGLAEGYFQAPFTVRADGGAECQVNISGCVERPVNIVPENLVFGPASPGETCARVARVILRTGDGAARAEATATSDRVSLTLRKVSKHQWELKATLTVPPDGAMADGRIRISLPGTRIAETMLPYSFLNLSGER